MKIVAHIRILVTDISAGKDKGYYLAYVITCKMEFGTTTPRHKTLSVSDNTFEYLIGISPKIMSYRYHRGIYRCYASTSSLST